MVLFVLQWNARSLIADGQEFKKYIDNLGDKPNVMCIQETWLKPQLDFILKGYTAVRRDREPGRGGGVATFIQIGVRYKLMSASTDHEAIVIKVWTDRGPIDVINYYNPCGKLNQDILEVVGGSSLDRVLWCGDFNSHNSLWGSNDTDANGTVIEEFIDYQNLVCINSGEGTSYNIIQSTESTLELTFVSSALAGIIT